MHILLGVTLVHSPALLMSILGSFNLFRLLSWQEFLARLKNELLFVLSLISTTQQKYINNVLKIIYFGTLLVLTMFRKLYFLEHNNVNNILKTIYFGIFWLRDRN